MINLYSAEFKYQKFIFSSHYENKPIQKILPLKSWKFSDKTFVIFHISAQNIACGYSLELPRQAGSNEYPHSMLLS